MKTYILSSDKLIYLVDNSVKVWTENIYTYLETLAVNFTFLKGFCFVHHI